MCCCGNCLLFPFLPCHCLELISAVLPAGFHHLIPLNKGSEFLPVCSSCFSALALFVSVCFWPSFCLSTHCCADIWNASATRCRPSTASSCFLCSWEWLKSHLNLSVQLLPSQVSKSSYSVYTATWPASTKQLADKVCLLGSATPPFWLMTSFEERGKKISKSGLLFSVSFS